MAIKNLLKITFVLLTMFMINLVFGVKVEALPKGVERVSIENWIKTREANDIGEGNGKKLNGVSFNEIENIGIGDDKVQILDILYQDNITSNREMRDINTLNKLLQKEGKETVEEDKILRTSISTDQSVNPYKFSSIFSWLKNTNKNQSLNVKWKEGINGNKYITWPCYSMYIGTEKPIYGVVEYRMLEGEFNLTKEQFSAISKNDVQAVLGVSTDNNKAFEMIIPFKDLINIVINEDLIPLNYRAVKTNYNFKYIKEKGGLPIRLEYLDSRPKEIDKYCNEKEHDLLTDNLDKSHADMNILKEEPSSGVYKMKGDITSYITKENNKIQVLIGQLVRPTDNPKEAYGGIGKIDLFLIETPKFTVKLKPYFIENNEKIYLDEDYKFSSGDKIYYDVEIINESNSFSYENLDLVLNFIIGSQTPEDVLKINSNKITYKNEDITNETKIYYEEELTDLNSLSSLNIGDKITISSDKINYIVTDYNSLKTKIDYNYILEFNYLDKYLFYKSQGVGSNKVNQLKGRLDITVDCQENCSDHFYVKIEGKNNKCNLKVKSNNTYTVDGLDLAYDYEVSLINSSTHKPVKKQIVKLTNETNGSKKSIRFSTSTKSNKYFTQRKIEDLQIIR
ncbi:MAG: hypothetical protein RR940_03220 [Bacilli bacterium]